MLCVGGGREVSRAVLDERGSSQGVRAYIANLSAAPLLGCRRAAEPIRRDCVDAQEAPLSLQTLRVADPCWRPAARDS